MPRLKSASPSYRRHRSSGQAVVTLDGRDHYLGLFNSAARRDEYDRLVSLWLANGRKLPETNNGATVVEMLAAFRRHAVTHYRKDGKPTRSLGNIDDAIRLLKEHHGRELVRDFGPLKLKALQRRMMSAYVTPKAKRKIEGLARKSINKRIGIIKQIFAWAVSEEMAPPSLSHALSTVRGLQMGRSDARETAPVLAVSMETIEATLPHLPDVVASMVRLQLATGMRPGELFILRPDHVDRSGEASIYTPSSHKTQHDGRQRLV